MDTYLNMRAFIAAAEAGSFSLAARELGLATSVLTKRVNQLEHLLKVTLFHRSTRSLKLTEVGRNQIQKCRKIVSQVEDLISPRQSKSELIDFIRIRVPITISRLFMGELLRGFIVVHPNIRMEVVITEHPMTTEDSSFDVSLGAKPITAGRIADTPLVSLNRSLYASPDYLDRYGYPKHPRDLVEHKCLSFSPMGAIWIFNTEKAPIHIEIIPKLSSNDGQLIASAAADGMGITMLTDYIVKPIFESGRLIPLLTEFPLPELWLTATVPANRTRSPAVEALLDYLRSETPKLVLLNDS